MVSKRPPTTVRTCQTAADSRRGNWLSAVVLGSQPSRAQTELTHRSSAPGRRSGRGQSGLVTGKPKPLKYTSIPGFLSPEQIAPHHTAHYGGALKGYSSLDEQLQSGIQAGTEFDANAYGAMQHARASKGNSVILHEFYFDALAPVSPDPREDVRTAISQRFGSLENWADDFQASAKAAAGWAMLTFHPVNGNLYNVVSDEHAMGPL